MKELKLSPEEVIFIDDSPNGLSAMQLSEESAIVFCARKEGFKELDESPFRDKVIRILFDIFIAITIIFIGLFVG